MPKPKRHKAHTEDLQAQEDKVKQYRTVDEIFSSLFAVVTLFVVLVTCPTFVVYS